MPYTTGSAADMAAVKTALVNACTADGWAEQTDTGGKTVLSKSGIYVRAETLADGGDGNPAFAFLGRTSLDGGDAPDVVMMGQQVFPVTYHIFTFTNEVFMVIQFSNEYRWCAFGQGNQSGLSGTGNWVGATFGNRITTYIDIYPTGGGEYYSSGRTSGALFWGTDQANNASANCWMHNDIETLYPWALGNGDNFANPIGIKYLTELIRTQPNSFDAESVLMPIRAYKVRTESKVSQILEVENARHIRIDNYNNEQIITLGTDQWMIFPYYKKDINNRDGDTVIDHSGTFGWAIKKEN